MTKRITSKALLEILNQEHKRHRDVVKKAQSEHDHALTRRDFLAHGLMTAGAYFFAPSAIFGQKFDVVAQSLADCASQSAGNTSFVRFMGFDAAGGMNIAGSNVLIGSTSQTNIFSSPSDYGKWGVVPEMYPGTTGVDTTFGVAFLPSSALLAGLKLGCDNPDAQARIDGALLAFASENDTSNNPMSAAYYIARSGSIGGLAALCGTDSGGDGNGGNSISSPAAVVPAFRAVQVRNSVEAQGLISAGVLASHFSQSLPAAASADARTAFGREKAIVVSRAIEDLSINSLGRHNPDDLPNAVRKLASCGYIKATELPNQFTPNLVDPQIDPQLFTAFKSFLNGAGQPVTIPNLAGQTSVPDNSNGFTGALIRTRAIAKLALDGLAGGGTVVFDGRDYHGNNRQFTDQRDFEIGVMMGQSLLAAHQKGVPLMLYLYSDGGVDLNPNSTNPGPVIEQSQANITGGVSVPKYDFTSDSRACSGSLVLVYRPGSQTRTQRAIVKNGTRQVGTATPNGVQEASTPMSSSPSAAAKWVALNYLALSGQESRFAEVVESNPFGANLGQYVIFNKIT